MAAFTIPKTCGKAGSLGWQGFGKNGVTASNNKIPARHVLLPVF
jgi:hypothetical protein